MPLWVRARPTYRHDPLEYVWDEQEDDHDEDATAPAIDVESRVAMPSKARRLNWERILRHVEVRLRPRAREQILAQFLDLFIDGDHKVTAGGDGHLYFWASPAEQALTAAMSHMDRDGSRTLAQLSMQQRREAVRPGYSLVAYAARRDVGTHAVFTRAIVIKDGVAQLARPTTEKPWWYKEEKKKAAKGGRLLVVVDGDDGDADDT